MFTAHKNVEHILAETNPVSLVIPNKKFLFSNKYLAKFLDFLCLELPEFL